MPLGEPLRIRHEEVVADELHALAEPLGEQPPAVPVVLGHRVLEREDRVAAAELAPPLDELLGAQRPALDVVGAVAVELGHRRVERDADGVVVPGVAGRREDQLDRGLGRGDLRREAALVADGRARARRACSRALSAW